MRRVLAGEHSVSALAAKYDMSFAAVQKHVAVLEKAGLLAKRRGREQLASGDVEAVRAVAGLAARRGSSRSGAAADRPHRRAARRPPIEGELTCPSSTSPRTSTPAPDHHRAPRRSVQRVWALYADPRQLEQVWGPPRTAVRRPRGSPSAAVAPTDRPRGRSMPAGGGSRPSTSRTRSVSMTASPTGTSTTTCRSR
ncbi:MAG: helix-turn-helix domain-containing protein [Nocardioides sp.]